MPRARLTRRSLTALSAAAVIALPFAAAIGSGPAAADVPGSPNITGGGTGNHPYVHTEYGGTTAPDATTNACSTDNRQQNESSLSVHPTHPGWLAAGSNDYCTIPTIQDAWEGLYTSTDNGQNWQRTVIPGYPGDTSQAGQTSPLYGLVGATGDPWDAFDNQGHLFVMGNAFNRSKPQNGSVWVATFNFDQAGPHYVRTVLLAQGVPAVNGPFNDKVSMAVDNSGGPRDGYVYAAWSQFQGLHGNNEINVAVSRDHGATFSKPVKVSQGVGDSQFADVTVTPSGAAYVVWRTFGDKVPKVDSAVYVKSTDGGYTWTRPATIDTFVPYDKHDQYGNPTAAAQYNDSLGADGVEGEDAGGARDCGDAPNNCKSGYTFYRDDSQTRITSDASGEYVTFNELENPHPTGTTYSPGGYSRVVLYRQAPGSSTWQRLGIVDNNGGIGHQTFPTVAAGGGQVTIGWNDSRVDSCFSQERPAGNCADGSAPPGGSLSTRVASWSESTHTFSPSRQVSGVFNPNWEQFGGRTVPFFGDYITAAYGASGALIDWTDNSNVKPAVPEGPEAGESTPDHNDVAGDPHVGGPCTNVYGPCFDATGGLDQDIFFTSLGG